MHGSCDHADAVLIETITDCKKEFLNFLLEEGKNKHEHPGTTWCSTQQSTSSVHRHNGREARRTFVHRMASRSAQKINTTINNIDTHSLHYFRGIWDQPSPGAKKNFSRASQSKASAFPREFSIESIRISSRTSQSKAAEFPWHFWSTRGEASSKVVHTKSLFGNWKQLVLTDAFYWFRLI